MDDHVREASNVEDSSERSSLITAQQRAELGSSLAARAGGYGGDMELCTISGAVEEPDDGPLFVEQRKLCMPCIVTHAWPSAGL